jgi:hypothetical protein
MANVVLRMAERYKYAQHDTKARTTWSGHQGRQSPLQSVPPLRKLYAAVTLSGAFGDTQGLMQCAGSVAVCKNGRVER